jgi:ATP-dependent DNA helicase RecG
MSRDLSFIAELIQQKESIQIEFVGDYKVPQIMKVICSFLNTQGGWVLVGFDGKELKELKTK